ncbi:MAG: VOC family protein [Acidimicrobiia bacterium]
MRISNIVLRVSDMETALAFWRDGVGLDLSFAGDEFAFFQVGDVSLMLNVPEKFRSIDADTEIVFEVDDVRETFIEMQGRGVPFEVELRPVTADGERSLLAAHFRDPDGNVASITGWVTQD